MAEIKYQRLTRAAGRTALGPVSITRASLWLGEDHVLCVESGGYAESYKRFYFRDIQAITTRRTNTRSVWNWVYGVMSGLLFLIGLSLISSDNTAAGIVFFSLFVLCIVGLGVNTSLGPTCACQIRTAVQTELLPLPRIRNARKFLDRVRPLITAAQGQLTAEELATRIQESATPNPAAVPAATPVPAAAPTPEAAPQADEDLNAPPRIVS